MASHHAEDNLAGVNLSLGERYGTARVRVRTDWETGRTYYTVTAPRVTGAWTIFPTPDDLAQQPDEITVRYGEADPHGFYSSFGQRPANRPRINGVLLDHGMGGITPETVEQLHGRRINAPRPSGEQAPEGTRQRLGAVLRALLRHWLARSDLDRIKHAAIRYEAPRQFRDARLIADRLAEHLAKLHGEHEAAQAKADHYRMLAQTDPAERVANDADDGAGEDSAGAGAPPSTT